MVVSGEEGEGEFNGGGKGGIKQSLTRESLSRRRRTVKQTARVDVLLSGGANSLAQECWLMLMPLSRGPKCLRLRRNVISFSCCCYYCCGEEVFYVLCTHHRESSSVIKSVVQVSLRGGK